MSPSRRPGRAGGSNRPRTPRADGGHGAPGGGPDAARGRTGWGAFAAFDERPGGFPSQGAGDPFAGVERVMIDGSNLLHALARGSGPRGGPAAPAPASAVIGRLRAAFPKQVSLELVFDGPRAGGITGRLAEGLRVSYSGRATADSLIVEGVEAQLAQDGPGGTWGILVVTDDRQLRGLVTERGARTAGSSWLAGRIARMQAPEPVAVRRGSPGSGSAPGSDAAARPPGQRSRPRPRGGPALPGPKPGTLIGHRRPPQSAPRDDDE
ncbi:MAG: NYN domain-containing protein [Chloroflexi bacterium]|nr:NYN domain-containing protein [Chloroflexota bacterium]